MKRTPRRPPKRAMTDICTTSTTMVGSDRCHMKRAGRVKITPAAKDSPRRPDRLHHVRLENRSLSKDPKGRHRHDRRRDRGADRQSDLETEISVRGSEDHREDESERHGFEGELGEALPRRNVGGVFLARHGLISLRGKTFSSGRHRVRGHGLSSVSGWMREGTKVDRPMGDCQAEWKVAGPAEGRIFGGEECGNVRSPLAVRPPP